MDILNKRSGQHFMSQQFKEFHEHRAQSDKPYTKTTMPNHSASKLAPNCIELRDPLFSKNMQSAGSNVSAKGIELNQLQVEIHAPPPEHRDSDKMLKHRLSSEFGVSEKMLKHRLSTESGDSMFYQHGTQDSYSSGYSGMSESHSSGVGVYHDSCHDNLSGYLNDYSEVGSCIQRIVRQKVRPAESELLEINNDNDTSFSSFTPASSLLESEDFIYLEKCDKIPELRQIPWNENEVLVVLKDGRAKHMSGHITVEMMQRVCFLLQRPLIRIAKEAQKLSTKFNICTRHEIEAAFKCVLSRSIAHSCQQACAKAVTLYSMSGDTLKQSKGSRCGLHFSVGKFQRWMIHAQVGTRIHEFAAIYLAACMESLVEEIVLRALSHEELGERVWNLDVLDYGITHNAELWGIMQPYEHLVCGRNAYGIATLPTDFEKVRDCSRERTYEQETVEECMLSTCFGSTNELGDLIYEVMTCWYTQTKDLCTNNKKLPTPVYWSSEALYALYKYTRCLDTQTSAKKNKFIHLANTRTYNLMPPLYAWVTSVLAFTEYRGCCMVTPEDVAKAAHVLLPTNLCHAMKPDSSTLSISTNKTKSASTLHQESQMDLLYRVALTGQHQLMSETLKNIGCSNAELLNGHDEQGLTLLMKAVTQGNEEAVLCLLNNSAFVNAKIPYDVTLYPSIHKSTRGWSALHFAVLFNHGRIVQQLLVRGSQVEGRIRSGEENIVVTPLQLACAAGNLELVSSLVEHGADPYLHTSPKNGVSFTYNRGGLSAFSMASMHGHRDVLKYLLRCPLPNTTDSLMSLEEIVREDEPLENGYLLKSKYHVYEEIPDNIYQTIDDAFGSPSRKPKPRPLEVKKKSSMVVSKTPVSGQPATCSSQPSSQRNSPLAERGSVLLEKLSKPHLRVLQDALYNAAECGFLDLVHDLRKVGVSWTLFSWGRCVEYAFDDGRHKFLEQLLSDFKDVYSQDEISAEFVNQVLPLMFDILKLNKDGPLKVKLSNILCSIYGKEPLPKLKRIEDLFYSIDPGYLNNAEHSDVKFLVEGQTIFAHKAVLMHSSTRLHKMLQSFPADGTLPVVQLNDVRYKVLQYILNYLYHGGTSELNVESKDIFELHATAKHYKLEGLRRHCEVLCVNKMHLDNCVMVYKNAKIHNALALMEYCEGFFVQNLAHLLANSESFHKMVYSRKRQNYNILGGMLSCLTQKLNARLENRRKLAPSVRI